MPSHGVLTSKPFLRALNGETIAPPPLWLMRQAGRYLPEYRRIRASVQSFLDLCYIPELAAEITLQPVRVYGFDAAILFSDILVIPDALGQHVTFYEGRGAVLDPLRSQSDVERLSLNRVTNYLAPVYESIRRLTTILPEKVALIGFSGAPWTLATYMIEGGSSKDFLNTRLWMQEGNLLKKLMELLIKATTQHLLEQIAAGVEAIQIFDTWAGILPRKPFYQLVIDPIIAITSAVHKVYPQMPIIVFPRGAGIHYEAFATYPGIQAISIDSSISPMWAAKRLQPYLAVQGNLDPAVLAAGGETMYMHVQKILNTLGDGPFIFNLGHGILPQTPPENVEQLVTFVRSNQE